MEINIWFRLDYFLEQFSTNKQKKALHSIALIRGLLHVEIRHGTDSLSCPETFVGWQTCAKGKQKVATTTTEREKKPLKTPKCIIIEEICIV